MGGAGASQLWNAKKELKQTLFTTHSKKVELTNHFTLLMNHLTKVFEDLIDIHYVILQVGKAADRTNQWLQRGRRR